MKICTIFAGSEISNTDFINRSVVNTSNLIICVDSGYRYARKLGITPDIVIGDFDSYFGTIPNDVEIYRYRSDKDDTDTMIAVKTAIEHGCGKIMLYGGLGGRFDHSIANIQTLVYALNHNCRMTVIDEFNEISVQGIGTEKYPYIEGWYISLFSLTEKTAIGSLTGTLYKLENTVLTIEFPLGVSNEIITDEAVLRVDKGIILVVRSKK